MCATQPKPQVHKARSTNYGAARRYSKGFVRLSRIHGKERTVCLVSEHPTNAGKKEADVGLEAKSKESKREEKHHLRKYQYECL
jgi:hypothetical protein